MRNIWLALLALTLLLGFAACSEKAPDPAPQPSESASGPAESAEPEREEEPSAGLTDPNPANGDSVFHDAVEPSLAAFEAAEMTFSTENLPENVIRVTLTDPYLEPAYSVEDTIFVYQWEVTAEDDDAMHTTVLFLAGILPTVIEGSADTPTLVRTSDIAMARANGAALAELTHFACDPEAGTLIWEFKLAEGGSERLKTWKAESLMNYGPNTEAFATKEAVLAA